MRRRLELPAERNAILGKLLRKLDERGCPYVLVGGLVPTLLREVLDPEPLDEPSESRSTVDCDLALDVAVSAADEWQRMQGILRDEGFGRFEKESQFCWSHPCGLMIDPMPVPAGIERGEPAAVSFARTFVERDTSKFFRGYELALQRPLIVEITFDGSDSYPLRIAGLPAMLAMKLQAWTDRRYERPKDAQDIGWLLRYLPAQVVVDQLRAAQATWPELVAEIISRLTTHFADEEAGGVDDYAKQAHGLAGYYGERHRSALVAAVQKVLSLYSRD